MSFTAYKFSQETNAEFANTLKKRVRDYFKQNNISKHANRKMVIKTIFMVSLYFIPFILMLTGLITNYWLIFLMWTLMSFGMSGIGLSIMHDANHGAYSKNQNVNLALSYLLNFLGGNVTNWRIQHNRLHHTFTNIEGSDGDLDGPFFLRFSPHKKFYKIHKFQHIYAWFFYTLLTMTWLTFKEFIQLSEFNKAGLTKSNKDYIKQMIYLVFWKIFYFAYALALPIYLIPADPWFIVICFLSMHLITSLVLSTIFQSAHILPTSEYPLPTEGEDIENNWFVHQLHNTANFATGSKWFTWYVGGLNHQVEHHLFPDVCHIHYDKISEIVKKTAQEYNIPYHNAPTFFSAIGNHWRMLHNLGKA